jgi:D-sedoheptulose 7-phosphate isomerase
VGRSPRGAWQEPLLQLQNYTDTYLAETIEIAQQIDRAAIGHAVEILRTLQASAGRLFILGVGGSAANASHATNDFRKIAGIETYCPTDNVAELTAWTNDVGWDVVFESWLKTSRIGAADVLMVFSVGGGSATTSQNLVRGMQLARRAGSKIVSVVSRDGGFAAKLSDACILVPVVSRERITPHAEGWQGIVWHLLVNAVAQPLTHFTYKRAEAK